MTRAEQADEALATLKALGSARHAYVTGPGHVRPMHNPPPHPDHNPHCRACQALLQEQAASSLLVQIADRLFRESR